MSEAEAEPMVSPVDEPDAPSVGEPDAPSVGEPAGAPRVGDSRPVSRTPLPPPPPPTIVTVEVVKVDGDEVEVRLADGRSGVIALREFGDNAPAGGTSIEAAILARTDPRQRVWLSFAWADKHRHWTAMVEAKASHEPVRGTVVRAVKGGFVVDVGLRAFLPTSLVDVDAPPDAASFIGTEIEAVVTEADPVADRLVISRRDHQRRQRRAAEKSVLASLVPGAKASGVVAALLDYGVQVDLGGVRGLIHRSELSWGRVDDLADVVSVGDTVEVKVLDVNKSKRRIGLSLRQTSSDPLAAVVADSVTEAVVTKVVEFGAFARLVDSGAEGLIHVSELTEMHGIRPDQIVMPGETVMVKVIEVDHKKRRLGLSVRQAVWS